MESGTARKGLLPRYASDCHYGATALLADSKVFLSTVCTEMLTFAPNIGAVQSAQGQAAVLFISKH